MRAQRKTSATSAVRGVAPQRIADARREASLLLFLTDLEPKLDQYDSAVDDMALYFRAQFEEFWACALVQKPITYSTPTRLYQLRSKITTSPAAGKWGR